MLDNNIKTQLKAYLEKLQNARSNCVASLDDSDQGAGNARSLLADIADAVAQGQPARTTATRRRCSLRHSPSACPGETPRITFAGIPMGHEFTFADPRACCRTAAIRPRSMPR